MKKNRVLKFLASLKLAVVIIIALGAMTAWGTFVEAKYDAEAAGKLVYNSPMMFALMGIFAINLIAVMVDRWPWQEKHTGFVLAHIGLLLLLLGAWMTKYYGVDGSMTIGLGDKSKQVIVGQTDLTLYSSMDASRYTKIDDHEVDFFLDRPTAEKPFEIRMPQGSLKVVDYLPYSFREQKILETKDENNGAAVRFQLQNPNVSVTEWLLQPGAGRFVTKDLGPAQIIFGNTEGAPLDKTRNSIVLKPSADGVSYEIHTAREPGKVRTGTAKPGDTVETGWMGLVLRVLKYMPHAKEEITFKPNEVPTPLTQAAILVDFNGAKHWVALNSMLKLFTDQAVYILTFANRRLDLTFDLQLKDFSVGRYPGTMRAASYESVVNVTGLGEKTISMNEPLKHGGFTFYQSSFQENDKGQPIASVFSVNRDPGRWVKYLGCLAIVFGSIHLFYFKRKTRPKNPAASAMD
jgi:ResB-like family